MLNIFYSKSNKIIEDEIFRRSIELYEEQKDIYIFVPEQFTLDNEIRLMDLIDEPAVSRIKIMSFERLALEVLSNVGGLKRKHIDNVGKTMIIKKILHKHKEELSLYKSLSEKKGFVDLLLNQISDFKRSNVSAVDLEKVETQNDLLNEKIQEIKKLYHAYEMEIGNKYVDNDDRLGQLSEIKNLSYLKDKIFFMYGFVDFTEVEKCVIGNLLNSGVEINIGLCMTLDRAYGETFDVVKKTYNSILDIANANGVKNKVEIISNNLKLKRRELNHLSENLFKLNSQKFKRFKGKYKLENKKLLENKKTFNGKNIYDNNTAKDISILVAQSVKDEINYIAGDISKKIVEENYRYKDIMVVSSDLQKYGWLIKQIFSKHNIPFFIDDKRDITNNTIIKLILSILNLLSGDFSIENLMSFLKNDISRMYENLDEIYDFENHIIAKRLKGKMFFNDKYFNFADLESAEELNADDNIEIEKANSNTIDRANENLFYEANEINELNKSKDFHNINSGLEAEKDIAVVSDERDELSSELDVVENGEETAQDIKLCMEEYEKARIENIINIRARIINLFKDKLDKVSHKGATVEEFNLILCEVLEEQNLYEKIQDFVFELRKNNLLDEANENKQIWDIFINLVEQSSQVFGDEIVSFNIYKNVLMDSIKACKLSVIPPTQDQVVVGDIARSRSLDKKILYICGVDANSMPSITTDDGIFTNAEKEQINEIGIPINSDDTKTMSLEKISTYILFDRPSEKLNISYATSGGAEESIYISKLRDIFQINVKNSKDEENDIGFSKPTLNILSKKLKHYKETGHIDEVWRGVFNYYQSRNDIMLENIVEALNYSNKKEILENIEFPKKMNVSRIKNFVDCPFKHFIQFGLKAKERKEEVIENTDIGILLHGTLEKVMNYFKENSDDMANISDEELENKIQEYFENTVAENLSKFDLEDKKNEFIVKRLKNTAKRIGKKSLEHIKSGEFEIFAMEQSFDFYQDIPPIMIAIDEKEIALTGKIDRIDIMKRESDVYVKIIDYKTSDKTFSLSDAYNGLDIQLLVYLYATLNSRLLNKNKVKAHPAGAFYFPVTNPITKVEGNRMEEDVKELVDFAVKMDGIVVDNDFIISAFDKENTGKKKRVIKGQSISENQLINLLGHIKDSIKDTLHQMMIGKIDVEPVKKQGEAESVCRYCNYANICLFEEELGDKYRQIKKYDKKELLEKLSANSELKE